MKYAIVPAPILGPCACQDCGEPLFWARRNTRVLNVTVGSLRWRDWNGRIHKCLARARANGYNGATGSSGESTEYSSPITHTAQGPSSRLYSEREGLGLPEHRRNA